MLISLERGSFDLINLTRFQIYGNHLEKNKKKSFKIGFRKIIKKTFQLPDNRSIDFDIKHEGPVVCVFALTKK